MISVRPLLRELLRAYADPAGVGGPARTRLRSVLLDQLQSAPDRALHLPAPRDPRLRTVASLLTDDARAAQSLTEVAAHVAVSTRTLTRLCRAELGMSFPQWRTQLRLHHGLELLADGHPVSVVATRCGWATPSAFIDVFRRHLGYTPGHRQRAAVVDRRQQRLRTRQRRVATTNPPRDGPIAERP